MRILVTGGAGFIGSALTRHVIRELGWQVVVLDKLTYAGHLSSLAPVADDPRFVFVKADVCDRAAVGEVLSTHQPDAVMHLAAETHVDRSILSAPEFVTTNVMGTAVLLEAVRDYWDHLPAARRDGFRLHHVSTDEIYGSLGAEGLFRETTPADPRSPYSATKAAADHLVSAWHHTYGLPAVITNCSNNFGPYQLPEKLIPLAILNALSGEPVPVYGDGLNVRDWLYVEDHVAALLAVLARGTVGERYNIGARTERTNLAVVEAICDAVDRQCGRSDTRALIRFVADRPGHDRRYAIDPSKLEKALGWRPVHAFEEALAATVKWYIDNGAWWRPLRKAGHGTVRLGLLEKQGTDVIP